MATTQQELKKDIELRRVLQIHNQSNTLAITVPSEWAEILHFEPKQYVRLEMDLDNAGFHVRRIFFQ